MRSSPRERGAGGWRSATAPTAAPPASPVRRPHRCRCGTPGSKAWCARRWHGPGAPALHVEGLAGLPLGSLLHFPLIVSLHDFAAFCPRPHLLERPFERFCHYSRDLARCGRCLRHDWPVDDAFQGERRELARDLLERATAVIYPSDFLRRTHFELFPGLEGTHRVVEPPAGDGAAVRPRPPGPLRHVAYVGSVQPHKGARVFEEVVRSLAGSGLRWSVYGGGDAEILDRLRRLPGVKVRGYYRSGTLARRLAEDRVDLALLLSTWPETFSLVLSECWTAGVPALAFDHGAIGDRIRAHGGGHLVPPEAGAEGIAAALRAGILPEVPAAAVASLPDARSAAAACLDVYKD